jgi:hypothetical protein
MTDEMQYIYYVYNPTMWWFDSYGNYNLDGLGVPHLLCKIGRTTQTPQQRLRQYNGENTGMPKPYRYKLLMRVNDCVAAESRVHKILKEQLRHCHQGAPGLGTEWFFATDDIIHTIFSTIIRDEFEGEFVDPPLPNPLHMMPEDIRKIVEKEDITTSREYAEAREKFGLPSEPWGTESAYYYLASGPRGHVSIGEFLEKLRRDKVRTASEYSDLINYHPECKFFPSLDNIVDGYYEGFKSFTEIVDRHFPQRRIRR